MILKATKLKTSKRNIIALGLVLLLSSTCAYAECFTGSMINSCTGTAHLGIDSDGVLIQQGQVFTVNCNSEVLSISFQLSVVEGGDINGVPYLQAGDELIVRIITLSSLHMESFRFANMPHSDGTEWVTFDFPTAGQTILEPGHYFVSIQPVPDRCAQIVFDTTDQGTGYQIERHGTDDWIQNADADVNHEIDLTQDYVGTEDVNWGKVKSFYRN